MAGVCPLDELRQMLVEPTLTAHMASRLNAHGTSQVMLSEVVSASASSVALGAVAMTGRTWLGGRAK